MILHKNIQTTAHAVAQRLITLLVNQQGQTAIILHVGFNAEKHLRRMVLHTENEMVGRTLPQRGLTSCHIVVGSRLAVASYHSRHLEPIGGNVTQRSPWHQQPFVTVALMLRPCRKIQKQSRHHSPLRIQMSRQQLIIQTIVIFLIVLLAVTDIVFGTCRQFQYW